MLPLSYHIHETSTNEQIEQVLSCANDIFAPYLLACMFYSADVFEKGETKNKVDNILGLISFKNHNFRNDLSLNLAFVYALSPKMAPFVEHREEQKC